MAKMNKINKKNKATNNHLIFVQESDRGHYNSKDTIKTERQNQSKSVLQSYQKMSLNDLAQVRKNISNSQTRGQITDRSINKTPEKRNDFNGSSKKIGPGMTFGSTSQAGSKSPPNKSTGSSGFENVAIIVSDLNGKYTV